MNENQIEVIVDSRLRISLDDVPERVAALLRKAFEHTNPQYAKLKAMRFFVDPKKEPPTIASWRKEWGFLTFPRGGTAKVREVLAEEGFVAFFRDRRTEGTLDVAAYDWPEHRMTPNVVQEKVLDEMILRENAILRAHTGTGKTSTIIAAIARLKRPSLVVVWSGGLFDQWVARIGSELGLAKDEIGQIRGSKKTIAPITIAMQQTIKNLPPEDPFWSIWGVVVCDEIQRFAAATVYRCVDSCPARYRFGASADERRTDRKEFLVHDVFGASAIAMSQADADASGRVVDVALEIVPTSWSSGVSISSPRDRFRKQLEAMETAEERDAIAIRIAVENVAAGEQVLLFSLRVDHSMALASALVSAGIPTGVLLGGAENKSAFDDAIEGLKSGRIRAAVGTVQAVGTGIDLPSVSRGIVTMPIAGNRMLLGQVSGRLCRAAEGKSEARLFYLLDPEFVDEHLSPLLRSSPVVRVADPSGGWIDAKRDRTRARALLRGKVTSMPGENG